MKRYSFNTKSHVKAGDLLDTDRYTTKMQVVEVLDKHYKYVNIGTGELHNKKAASTKNYEIRELRILADDDSSIVNCSLVK